MEEFSSNGDVGEVWFGEEAEDRVIDWLTHGSENLLGQCLAGGAGEGLAGVSVLDIGMGNGHFLVKLVRLGWR